MNDETRHATDPTKHIKDAALRLVNDDYPQAPEGTAGGSRIGTEWRWTGSTGGPDWKPRRTTN